MPLRTAQKIKVADEVWIATALLHRERPTESDFSIAEIMERAHRSALTPSLRPGVYVHVVQHCVANRPPNPGRYRMLFETAPGRRRLFRTGDPYNPARDGGKITPASEDLPLAYNDLLNWYRDWTAAVAAHPTEPDPLLALRGSGKELWADEHADDYIRRLREDWE